MEKKNLKAVATKAVAEKKVEVKKPAVKKTVAPKKVDATKKVEPVKEEKAVEKKPVEKKPVEVSNFTISGFIDKCNAVLQKEEMQDCSMVVLDTAIGTDAKYIAIKGLVNNKEVIYKLAYARDGKSHRISLHTESVNGERLLAKHTGDAFAVQLYSVAFAEAVENAAAEAVAHYGIMKLMRPTVAKESLQDFDAHWMKIRDEKSDAIIQALLKYKDDARMQKGFCNSKDMDKPADYQHIQLALAK